MFAPFRLLFNLLFYSEQRAERSSESTLSFHRRTVHLITEDGFLHQLSNPLQPTVNDDSSAFFGIVNVRLLRKTFV